MAIMQNKLTEERKGELIILVEAFLWSLFPIVTVLAFRSVPTLLALAWSTFFAAAFFASVIGIKKGWDQIKDREAIRDILMATFILGIVYYLLFFFGLQYTSPGNASIISLTEIFFSFLFFNIWRKEHISNTHIAGSILMLLGALIVLYPNLSEFHMGDLFILMASFIAPLGNFFQRQARKKVSSETILFIRSLLSALVMFIVAYFAKVNFSTVSTGKIFILLAVNGFFLLGLSKLLWVEGIYRINVAKAGAVSGISPLLTMLFAWIILGSMPTKFQLLAFVPMFFGMILLSRNKKIQT